MNWNDFTSGLVVGMLICAVGIVSILAIGNYTLSWGDSTEDYGFNGVLPHGTGYYEEYNDGTWSYKIPEVPNYPTWCKHIDPQVSVWDNETIGWNNGTQRVIYSIGSDVIISDISEPFYGSDGGLEGFVHNVFYSEISCKVYDVTFAIMEETSNGRFELVEKIYKTCLVTFDLLDDLDDLWTWDKHRVYYEETNNPDFWIIHGVYEWNVGFVEEG